ncbi:hypothetical protein D3C87_331910 [compost metagenome]|jgi:hypothetical protein
MKYGQEQLKKELSAALIREGEAVMRQFVARGLTMTSVGFADFEVELRKSVHELAMKYSKSVESTVTTL